MAYQDEKSTQAPVENGNLLSLTFISQLELGAFTSVCRQADANHAELTA